MTNQDLVPVFTGSLQDQTLQLCNARDLHAFLDVRRDFSNWIKGRIAEYGFIEGEDFSPNLGKSTGVGGDDLCSPDLASKQRGGHNRIDYHLTLDMAKELAMIENNDQGRQARRYFIQCERAALQAAAPAPVPQIDQDDPHPGATAVPFQGTTLYIIDHHGTPYVALRPIVIGMGLVWKNLHASSHAKWRRWGLRLLPTPTNNGVQEATCIPLRKLAAWLATLDRYLQDPARRDAVAAYQATLNNVLWAHWRPAARPLPAPDAPRKKPNTLPAIPRAGHTAIHQRAWQLAHDTYAAHVAQMLADPSIAAGTLPADQWLPPDQAILQRVEGIALTLRDAGIALRLRGQTLARQMGHDYDAATQRVRES